MANRKVVVVPARGGTLVKKKERVLLNSPRPLNMKALLKPLLKHVKSQRKLLKKSGLSLIDYGFNALIKEAAEHEGKVPNDFLHHTHRMMIEAFKRTDQQLDLPILALSKMVGKSSSRKKSLHGE